MSMPRDKLTQQARARGAVISPHRRGHPTGDGASRAGSADGPASPLNGLTGDPFPVLVDALPVIVWMTDELGNTIQVNQAGFAFSGVTPEQISGYGWRPLVHVDDLPDYEKAYRQALAAKRGFNLDCRIRRADGAYRWLLNTGVPRLTPDGEFAGYTAAASTSPTAKRLRRASSRKSPSAVAVSRSPAPKGGIGPNAQRTGRQSNARCLSR